MKKNANEFSVTSDHAVTEMHSDEAKLRQSLTNLLGNAAKFTSNGRVGLAIRKETLEKKDWVVFEVSDSGIGMDETQIPRRYGGTGLGLSLTKQFCEMLGGHLTVQSALQQGTTFTLKVPVRSKEPEETVSALNQS